MKRIILGALGLLAALAWSGPSLAQGNSCAGGAIPGMVVGGTTASGACYYIKVNSDGSINTTGSGTSGGSTPTTSTLAGTSTTTASPTYVTGTMNPLNTDVHGAARILQMNPDGTAIDTTLPQTVQANNIGSPTYAQVSVGSTATLLFSTNTDLHDKGMCNFSATLIVYWGYDALVTTGNGIPIPVGTATAPTCIKPWSASSIPTSAIYGIVASSTATVAVYGQ